MFAIIFGFKQSFINMLTILNRRFKNINTLTVDVITGIYNWIRRFIVGLISYIGRIIS